MEEVGQGRQAYVVCARISSNSSSGTDGENLGGNADGAAAPAVAVEDLFEELRNGPLAGVRVEMVHGQLPSEEKDAVMGRFAGRRDRRTGRHDGGRGWGGCAQRLGDGDP